MISGKKLGSWTDERKLCKTSHPLSSSPLRSSANLFTMQFYGALILFLTVATACGLQCYNCGPNDPESCRTVVTCPAELDRCSSVKMNGMKVRSCILKAACVDPITCCDKDLCNSAVPAGSSVILMLLSSAIITIFF